MKDALRQVREKSEKQAAPRFLDGWIRLKRHEKYSQNRKSQKKRPRTQAASRTKRIPQQNFKTCPRPQFTHIQDGLANSPANIQNQSSANIEPAHADYARFAFFLRRAPSKPIPKRPNPEAAGTGTTGGGGVSNLPLYSPILCTCSPNCMPSGPESVNLSSKSEKLTAGGPAEEVKRERGALASGET
jgi:hypothetical protein